MCAKSASLDWTRWNFKILTGRLALPQGPFYGLGISRVVSEVTLVAATYNSVWGSPDDSATWEDITKNLPRHPRCVDLRFGNSVTDPPCS